MYKKRYFVLLMVLFVGLVLLLMQCFDSEPIPTITPTLPVSATPSDTPEKPTLTRTLKPTDTPTIEPSATIGVTITLTPTNEPTLTPSPTIEPDCIVVVTVEDQIEHTFWWSAWHYLNSALRWQEIQESNDGLNPRSLQYGQQYIVECDN